MPMISNLSYPVPTIGRIAIGEMVEKNGKRLPNKLNHFKITALYKKDGQWVEHPLAKPVAAKQGVDLDHITEIPVKVMFNDPDLVVRERYEAFDRTGMTVCAGDGKKARRVVGNRIESTECPGADVCQFAKDSKCALFVRANFQINAEAENFVNDEMSTFILRSRGYNTARSLNRKLNAVSKLFGGRLIGVPFKLKLRTKSATKSCNSPFYFVDLMLDAPLREAFKMALDHERENQELGLDQAAFEAIMRDGILNGPFEDGIEEIGEIEDLIGDFDDNPGAPVSHAEMTEEAAVSMDKLRSMIESAKPAQEDSRKAA